MRALAERLDEALAGRTLGRLSVLGFTSLKTVAPTVEQIAGRRLEHVGSRGKYLIFGFGSSMALVHLGNAGRVDLEAPPKATRPRGAVARFDFGDVAMLVREHGTERRAGLWLVDRDQPGPLESLGPEPEEEAFADLVLRSEDRRHLHTILRDQRTVAGVGRGYADDALNRARLSPFAALARLDPPARERLLTAVRDVLAEALERERQRSGGLSEAKLGDRFAVHRRAGLPCPNCGNRLERVSFESNDVVYCPQCQTKGRLLADRRMSRLLR